MFILPLYKAVFSPLTPNILLAILNAVEELLPALRHSAITFAPSEDNVHSAKVLEAIVVAISDASSVAAIATS